VAPDRASASAQGKTSRIVRASGDFTVGICMAAQTIAMRNAKEGSAAGDDQLERPDKRRAVRVHRSPRLSW
jgi:hypothetical protein